MPFYKDWFFYTLLVSVLIAIIPQLSSYLPKAVVDIVLVLLNGVALFIKQYQTREAYSDGKSGVVGSKYQP